MSGVSLIGIIGRLKNNQVTSVDIMVLITLILVIPVLLVTYVWIAALIILKIVELFDDWI